MKRALLTGVGREGQVGEAVASRLAADGFELILVDRTFEKVRARAEAVRAGGGVATPYSCDLADADAVASLIRKVAADHGDRLDAMVHMAGGFAAAGPVADIGVADWDRQLTINLRTAFLTARATIPMLRMGRGAMVFFSSEAAVPGAKLSGISAYAVAKIGVSTLAIAISQEERGAGIRANVLAPAAIRTATNTASMDQGARFVEREDVSATVAYLCSEASRGITGQVFRLGPR
jgi:NAD(P)-dependent dehydrogenase (short-subunit alcohol dehydrogenase family)